MSKDRRNEGFKEKCDANDTEHRDYTKTEKVPMHTQTGYLKVYEP